MLRKKQRNNALKSDVAASLHDQSDAELARLSQAGSLPAFEELVYRYEGRLYRFVANGCRNDTDAREITQDSFVRAFQAIAQFDPAQPFAPWLFAIARRKRIDHRRALPPTGSDQIPDVAAVGDPAESLAAREETEHLWRFARQRLSEAQFETLWLKYAEDLSVAQIAQVLRKTRTHVKVLLFRARLALGRAMEAAGWVGAPSTPASPHRPGDVQPILTTEPLRRLPAVRP